MHGEGYGGYEECSIKSCICFLVNNYRAEIVWSNDAPSRPKAKCYSKRQMPFHKCLSGIFVKKTEYRVVGSYYELMVHIQP